MKRNLATLSSDEFDLLVVGGGIFGICAAWDAVLRGLSVALIEQKDFASGTSANSYKVVHGGIRYLQHLDWVRIRSSCKERSALLRVAPHLVQPLPIVIPTYGHGKKGKELLATGMRVYDLVTYDRNAGISDPERHIPPCRSMSRQEVLDLFPALDLNGLTGAMVFCDGQMYNPTRLALSFLRSAIAEGVQAANYVEAIDFLRSDNQVKGVLAQDKLTGDTFEIRAKVVLNAAGPWSEWLLAKQFKDHATAKGTYSRDACFVIPRRITEKYALAVPGRTKDPDAVLSREARHLFVVPWRDYTLIGVWHLVYRDHPDTVTVPDQDLEMFIDEINWAYPSLNIRLDEVSMWNAGLLPFGENKPGAKDLSYGKRSRIIDHSKQHQVDGLVTLIGVRYTMARGDSAQAIDLVSQKLGKGLQRSATDQIPVYGGKIENFEKLVQSTIREGSRGLSPDVIRALIHNYGSEYNDVLKYVDKNPAWAETLGRSKVMKAEVIHAVHEEMAINLGDVVFRRTDLATGENPGEQPLRECAELMASELGWTREQIDEQFREVVQRFPSLTKSALNASP